MRKSIESNDFWVKNAFQDQEQRQSTWVQTFSWITRLSNYYSCILVFLYVLISSKEL